MSADVTDALAHSGSQSLMVSINPAVPNPVGVPGYGSDVFLDLPAEITSGQWNLSYWVQSLRISTELDLASFQRARLGKVTLITAWS